MPSGKGIKAASLTAELRKENMKRRKRLTFWHVNEEDDSLVRNVIAKKKTATAAILEDFYKSYGEYGDGGYEVGDIVEVYDPKKNLRCLIEITDVHPIKFGDVPERVWRGETFSSAEEFRECHFRCIPDHELHDDVEFMITHFRLVEEFPDSNETGGDNPD